MCEPSSAQPKGNQSFTQGLAGFCVPPGRSYLRVRSARSSFLAGPDIFPPRNGSAAASGRGHGSQEAGDTTSYYTSIPAYICHRNTTESECMRWW